MRSLLQFTLDLFDAATPEPGPQPKRPRARRARTQGVSDAAPAQTQMLDALLTPASFVHPHASREAVLGDLWVG